MFSFENWIIQFAGKPKASKNDYKDKKHKFWKCFTGVLLLNMLFKINRVCNLNQELSRIKNK